jgi:hypothetical protein
LVCFFTISSIFGNDIKGIVYLVGLLLSIGLVIISESIFPNLDNSWFIDKENAMCNLFSFGQSNLSNLSIGQIIIGFSFSYLVYTMNVVNEKPVFASNWPTIVFFSLLVIAELGINTNISHYIIQYIIPFIKTNLQKIIMGAVAVAVGVACYFAFAYSDVGNYFGEHAYLMVTNILIIGVICYMIYDGYFKKDITEAAVAVEAAVEAVVEAAADPQDYCYQWSTSLLTYIIAGGLGVGWATVVSAFDTPRLQYFNKGETSDSCGKVKNDQFACKVYKNGDPNKAAITDDSQCPLNGANNRLLEGVDDKDGFIEGTYTGLSQVISLASGGTDAKFNVTVNADGDITDIVVDNNGKNYKKGDEIAISKSGLGPSTKDLYIKIKSNRLLDCSQTVE